MTVLCAMHDAEQGCTWIGSDTYATMGVMKFHCAPKWVVGPHWAVGCAGDGRLQTLVESKMELDEGKSPTDIAEQIREIVKEDGWNTNSEPGAPDYGVWIIIASPDGVWSVCSAFSVDRIQTYWADGAGAPVAMGAMYSAVLRSPPELVVTTGIRAAIAHERSCGGEAWVECLGQQIAMAAE